MAPAAPSAKTPQPWTTAFDTKRRHDLFSNPPKDKTAYPMLAAAVDPHINSCTCTCAQCMLKLTW
jgi:DNA-directed RNA polymerase I subunit RPA2